MLRQMLGPVRRAGHQGDRGWIHDVEQAVFEAKGKPRRVAAGKGRDERLQMSQDGAEELLDHFRVAGAVGVGKGVFGGRGGAAQSRERTGVQAQRITHVIETEGVSQLGVEQADDLAPGAESAGVIFDAGVAGQFGHQVWRNEIAKLTKNGEFADGWLVAGFLFHALPCGRAQTRRPTFFYPSTLNLVGQQ